MFIDRDNHNYLKLTSINLILNDAPLPHLPDPERWFHQLDKKKTAACACRCFQSFAESLVDERCQRMSKTTCNKGKALHISQWIKGELRAGTEARADGDSGDGVDELELWSVERMNAKNEETQRRLSASRRDGECGGETMAMEILSVTCSSPNNSQVRVNVSVPSHMTSMAFNSKLTSLHCPNPRRSSPVLFGLNVDSFWPFSHVMVYV